MRFMVSVVILFIYICFILYYIISIYIYTHTRTLFTSISHFYFPIIILDPDSSVRQKGQTDSLSAHDRALLEQVPCISGWEHS